MSLPKGPGSIEGLATADLAPSMAMGSASYSIPLVVPPASAEFGPHLALAYDSGGALTELGMGWRISGVPEVRRRTEDGLPRFDDSDAFELIGIGIPSKLVEVGERLYRPAVEDGSFVRLERSKGGTSWEARTKAGPILLFGGDGFVEGQGARVAGYLLREERDRHGHVISYEWDTTEGHALLTGVVWNAFDESTQNEMRFLYEPRPDVHRGFSSGILETLSRRLKSIAILHGGAPVRTYELSYGTETHPELRSVELVGADGVTRMPASRFEYTQVRLAASKEQVVAMQSPPGHSPADPDTALADLNGDSLPDLFVGKAGHFRSYLNRDGVHWDAGEDWKDASPSVSLSEQGVQLADVDADGAMDLLVKSGTNSFRYFPSSADGRFGSPITIASVPGFSFEDPDVRLADIDGDRRTDVIMTTDAGIAVGYDVNGVDWTEPALVGRLDGGAAAQSVRFSDGQTSLCDVNGDRVQDVCSLHSGGMTYWLGRGRGLFEPGARAHGVPEFDAASPFQLADLNGDGWADLVRVGATQIELALANSEGGFGSVQRIDGTPPRGPATAVEFADMNGSGTTDVVWVDVTADGTMAWRYLELFPDGRAGLLHEIDNGLGKVQTIEYAPAAVHAARARAAGKPWSTRLDLAIPVVTRTTVELSLGDPPVVTEWSYRDGVYDTRDRTFAGFQSGTRRQIGDSFTPTLIVDRTFDAGLVHRELRGAPLAEETRDEDGNVFERTTYGYASRVLETGNDGEQVGYSYRSSRQVEFIEGDSSAARTVLTETEQDDYGDVTIERSWGEVDGDSALAGNDEALTVRTYADDPAEWVLGQVATEEITDGAGRRVALRRRYYDGEPMRGLPLGQVTRGDLSREEAWVGPGKDDFELVIATRYDADGMPVETKDGRGGGRFFEWAGHTSIASERVKLDGDNSLVERAAIDGRFGTLLAATDYSGQTTRYEYDALGRLSKVVKPGDSSALPTVSYTYEALAPLSRVVTESRLTSGEPDVDRSEVLFDGGGRERGTLTRDGSRWILAGVSLYDARGRPKRTLLPRGVDEAAYESPPLLDATPRGSDVFHDALGREILTRSPSGIETRTVYAPLEVRRYDGGQSDSRSPYEHTPTVERKDGLGRVVEHVRTLKGKELKSRYTYDAAGNLLSRTDPEGNVARYTYDGRGRRTVVVDPDAGEQRFTYDATGNVIERRYPDGDIARFGFDLAGRSLTEDWDGDGTPEIVRTWDQSPDGGDDAPYLGRLARVTEPSGYVEHSYDTRGRVTSTLYDIDGVAYLVGSDYDAQDREIRHTYPDGVSLEIHRNARGQVSAYGRAVQFEYSDDGLETKRRFGSSAVVTTGYDDDRRRTELTVASASGSTIEHLRWSYDTGSNLVGVDDLRPGITPDRDRSETYAYDNLYRLVGARGAWGETSYRYSDSGNLLDRNSSVPVQDLGTLSYGTRPHLPAAIGGRATSADARGRMIHDGKREYTWNPADELVRVQGSDGASVESVYGADGFRRIRIEHHADGTSTTTHFIDDWSEEHDGKLTRYIVHGGQRIVRLGADSAIAGHGSRPASIGAPHLAPSGGSGSGPGEDTARPGNGWQAPSAALRGERRHAPSGGLAAVGALLCAAFVLGALRMIARRAALVRRALSSEQVIAAWRALAIAILAGAALAMIACSAAPASTALALAVCAALCMAPSARVARVSRALIAVVVALGVIVACGGGGGRETAPPHSAPGREIVTLAADDVFIVNDLLGSVVMESTLRGDKTSEFAVYPFGATRYDTTHATWKYARSPRDTVVGLDHMGARFYAPDLGVWTSPDPLAVTAPGRLVTSEFAAANPYAYANQTPLIAEDHDGHFWQIAIGAAVGALVGAGSELYAQYHEHGRIEDVGRVGAAALGGAVCGAITTVMPGVAGGVIGNVGGGITRRLIESHGKSAGTLHDVVVDGVTGIVKAGLNKAATGFVKAAAPRVTTGAKALGRIFSRSAAAGAGALSQGVASDARLFQAYRAELAAQEIEGAEAVGSALRADPYHRSASFVTDMAREGKVFSSGNRTGTVNLTQVLGEMNGVSGRFEWIVDGSGNLTHQMFVRGGGITGVPIVP